MLSYYVIYYEKFKKSHAEKREGSFKVTHYLNMGKGTSFNALMRNTLFGPTVS